MKRRNFIKKSALGLGLGLTGGFSLKSFAADRQLTNITILHTNDVHSRIDPFPSDAGENAGRGGFARRSSIVSKIRSEVEHLLLLDAGDILQGTPYFNMFGGELEFKLMSAMGYDAATIGNHEFDAGIDGLVKQWPHINFPFVSSNYDFSDTDLAGKVRKYLVLEKGPIKVGILGLGIELRGLVPKTLFGNTRYLDPLAVANEMAALLKNEEKCDYIICLSHLGLEYETNKVSDMIIAKNTENIDLIIGGHTHVFMESAIFENNLSGKPVMINQVGRNGIMMGRIDLLFEENRRGRCVHCENFWV